LSEIEQGKHLTVSEQPREPNEEDVPTGFPEPPGRDPGDRSHDPTPHHALNNPADQPDPSEWPDPYERRPDPRDPDAPSFGEAPHPQTGSESTSDPHPQEDPEAEPWAEGPKRDKVDE
jgi:hypothetical protein